MRLGWREAAAWFGIAALGAALGVWPHLARWRETGDWTFVADGDELLYLSWCRAIREEGSRRLTDGVRVAPEDGPMMHPWATFALPTILGAALGVGAEGMGAFWRGLAGAALGLGLYGATRGISGAGVGVCLGLSAALLCDPGLAHGQPGLGHLRAAISPAWERSPVPNILAHMRAPTPAIALAGFFWFLGRAGRLAREGGRGAAAWTGISLGLLFHLHFYCWTAATAGLVLAAAGSPGRRRGYRAALAIGLAIGAPAVVEGYRIKVSTPGDWFERTEKFVRIGRFEEWLFPRTAVLVAGACLWAGLRRGGFAGAVPAALTGLAGLALVNHQALTGLQIENDHWLIPAGAATSAAAGGILAAGAGAGGIGAGGGRRRVGGLALVWVWAISSVAAGFGWRDREAFAFRETRGIAARMAAWRAEGIALERGAVVGGDPGLVTVLTAFTDARPLATRNLAFSARTTNREISERLALNLLCLGMSSEDAERALTAERGMRGWWEYFPHRPEFGAARRAERREALRAVSEAPGVWLRRFGVTDLLVPRGSVPVEPGSGVRLRLARAGRVWDHYRLEYDEGGGGGSGGARRDGEAVSGGALQRVDPELRAAGAFGEVLGVAGGAGASGGRGVGGDAGG